MGIPQAWHPLPGWGGFVLRGSDALTWLQGQVTQDLRLLEEGHSVRAVMATPTGQIGSLLVLGMLDGAIIVAATSPDVVASRIEDFVIMEDIEVETASSISCCVLEAPDQATPGCHSEPNGESWIALGSAFPEAWIVVNSPSSHEWVKEGELSQQFLLRGLPDHLVEAGPRTLPPELGPAFVEDNISYTKGCYVGQEIIHRIYSRGHTNKTWMAVATPERPVEGAKILVEGVEAGEALRSVRADSGVWVTSAFIRRGQDNPGPAWVDGMEAVLAHHPYLRS